MSWLFSRALVEAYSAGNCSGGEPSAQLNWMPTRRRFYRNDKMTAYSSRSLFGLTLKRLTAIRGRALLTWFREDFLARTSAQQDEAQASPGIEVDCGKKWPAWFARYDRVSSSWKTRQCSLLGDSESFSETWPRWGLMRNGVCSERSMPVLPTRGKEYGFWPTARSTDALQKGDLIQAVRGNQNKHFKLWPTPNVPNGGRRVPKNAEIKGGSAPTAYVGGKKCQVGLEQAVKWWPTPHGFSKDGLSNGPSGNELGRAVNRSMLPTPTKSDGTGGPGCSGRDGGKNLRTEIGGSLNPPWVEWLMGWPIGWTDLKPLETDRFRQWLHSHGKH